MSRLFLLRHARAAWAEPGHRDFDRPLTGEGHAESTSVGELMRANGLVPDLVICSTARRALETWRGLAEPLGMPVSAARLSDALYSGDASAYLALVRDSADTETLLVVGHNPMIEDLALGLSAATAGSARRDLENGFPTAGLAVLAVGGDLSQAMPGAADLEAFFIPSGH